MTINLHPPSIEQLLPGISASRLSDDTRTLQPGEIYIACPSANFTLDTLVTSAVQRGAAAVLFDSAGYAKPSETCSLPIPVIGVPQLSLYLSAMSAEFYGYPAKSMRCVGVTGTNGKTTCTQWIAQALTLQGCKVGLIGTLGAGVYPWIESTGYTTPSAVQVQTLLSSFRESSVEIVVMEVSSHALALGRVSAVDFELAALTQVTQDHLDFHENLDAYYAAKEQLFNHASLQTVVVNADDVLGSKIRDTRSYPKPIISYAVSSHHIADFMVREFHQTEAESQFIVQTVDARFPVTMPLLGQFNIENVLLVMCVLHYLGFPMAQIVEVLPSLHAVAGRLECVSGDQHPKVYVDYAHTPDALENVLSTLSTSCEGRLWCVFGCGGEREQIKRPGMGAIAERLADQVILTNDNPRNESPEKIIDAILSGMASTENVSIMTDRKEAIQEAMRLAKRKDVILIAGKGHETVQVIGDRQIHLSDREIVKEFLNENS